MPRTSCCDYESCKLNCEELNRMIDELAREKEVVEVELALYKRCYPPPVRLQAEFRAGDIRTVGKRPPRVWDLNLAFGASAQGKLGPVSFEVNKN